MKKKKILFVILTIIILVIIVILIKNPQKKEIDENKAIENSNGIELKVEPDYEVNTEFIESMKEKMNNIKK